MEQHFFIGTLEIVFDSEQELTLDQFDRLFLQPVLPVEAWAHVRLRWTDELDVPPRDEVYFEAADFLIWRAEGEEHRLYLRWQKEPALASHFFTAENRVCISALRGEREAVWAEFRPWFHIHLERLLLGNRALILHSASILYRGEAILFTAPSGTGKTTQTDLWHRYREGISDLNGDRTLLQQTEGGWYGCGFPIYGSMVRCAQTAAPIRAIAIIRQAERDAVRELSPAEKVMYLYSECTVMRPFPDDIDAAMNLLEALIGEVTVIRLDCTMEASAVDVLHAYLYGE